MAWHATARLIGSALVPTPGLLAAQSALLSSLESSVPAPVVEPTAGVFAIGLPGIWSDPTTSACVTGAFFGMYTGTYASVRIYHVTAALRLGPRWSFTFGQSEIANLFDSSLTAVDPSLATLQARAVVGNLDATATWRNISGSLGAGFASDENVGEALSSTTGRAHLRMRVLPWLSVGIREARVLGGSLPANRSGRLDVDAVVTKKLGLVVGSLAAAASRGALWRYSETDGSFSFAALATLASVLDLSAGIGRYVTTFGARDIEWYRSVSAGLHLGSFRVGVRYTGTDLGIGSGYGVGVSYEPVSGLIL